ncbi:pentatricopeptide repeat-containing protein At3g09040, mitochondrial isoform X1 [Selaginella moellendorffii]|uniref:pentatricopeptide repeat-containing protein At3g09040, mitochondrial isoform X1 n=1 Tax=Selaginella moellendorffii TaxID=88036 RepID=UPI000D1D0BF3|nr:pentatricopeptide repeat-containing protein At3g09040, mitochondrial isoform X1 [Selaginella moellendorffii]|eukprot:XP_024520045.1 pentatricopeptide repeat-containing protein At3g09040, mitochondrial isoform X1 [Selaginella moellendorffii]
MQESALLKLQQRSGVIALNKIAAAYAHAGHLAESIESLERMREEGLAPDRGTFLALLGLCAKKSAIAEGRFVHSRVEASEFRRDDLVQNATIHMYGKCGCVEDAVTVFQSLDHPSQAFQIFQRMKLQGLAPDRITFVTVLDGCTATGDLSRGKLLHGFVLEAGLERNVMVGTSLIKMYGKCGCVEDARRVFDKLALQDVVSWTSMIMTYVQHDRCVEALELFHRMRPSGVLPNRITYATAISACAHVESMADGKLIHSQVLEDGFESDVVVSCAIVNMYGKCGSLEDAREVFERMPHPNTVSWNAIVAACTQHGCCVEALWYFQRMQLQGVRPDKIAFVTILTACSDSLLLHAARAIHAQIFETGLDRGDDAVITALLNVYSKCGSLEDTRFTFERIGDWKTVNSYTRMVGVYVQHGFWEEAFKLFREMQLEGSTPDKVTFITILNACSSPATLTFGELLYECILQCGYDTHLIVGNCIMTMYSSCGRIDNAAAFFSTMVERDAISWNTIISGHAQAGFCDEAVHLFRRMLAEGITPDKFTFISIIDGTARMQEAKILSELMVESGVELDVFLVSALINMHSRYGNVREARSLFDDMKDRDIVMWTSIISSYVQHGSSDDALGCTRLMRLEGLMGNDFTLVTALNACASLTALSEGKLIHSHAIERGFAASPAVGNALINMYAKCGCLEEADLVFHQCGKNLVSWNTIAAAYVQRDKWREALQLFQEMQLEGLKADKVSFVTVLNGCSSASEGSKIHNILLETGMESDHIVSTALLNMYTASKSLDEASRIFSRMEFRDIVSWNAMIAGKAEHGLSREAIQMFQRMQLEGVAPDKISFVTVLNAFSGSSPSSLKQARLVEKLISDQGYETDTIVGNAIVSMFGRSGRLAEARRAFERIRERDAASWNVIVTAHAQHGEVEQALKLFRRMQQESSRPDSITLVSVLSACSHGGLIEEGYYHFTSMGREFGIAGSQEHYGCVVDLLARAGRLDQAEELLRKMPVPASYVLWMTLLSACKVQGDEKRAKRVAERVMELDPRRPAAYVVLSSV